MVKIICLGQYKLTFVNFGGVTRFTIHFSFTIYKNEKITRTWPILKSNSTSFWCNYFFQGWIIKKNTKREGRGPHSIFLGSVYSSSNWYHSKAPNSGIFSPVWITLDPLLASYQIFYLLLAPLKNGILPIKTISFLNFQLRNGIL